MSHAAVTLTGTGFTLAEVERVARHRAPVVLDPAARTRIVEARGIVDRVASAGTPVYGLTTALGANTGAALDTADLAAYQQRAVQARAVGVGDVQPTDVVRATIVARLAGMAVGGSGASIEVVDALLAMLNAQVHPVVPRHGSIGAADLAPLSHLALPLLGQGVAEHRGEMLAGSEALARAGVTAPLLTGKDGMALISSNAATLGEGALVLVDAARALDAVNMACALMHEAFRANVSPLDARVQALRRAPAQERVAARLRGLLDGGELLRPGAARRLQDPISLRCVTQVHGACLAALQAARDLIERDLNAATESPVVLPEQGEMISNGNFDTTDIAIAFETLGLALAHVAALCVQRCQRLYSPATSGLPLQLTPHGPRHSGFATLQKTLVSLRAQIRHLANPVTLDALPVSEAIEDHASLAPLAIGKVAAMLPLLERLAAIELVTAAQAVDLRGTPMATLGNGTRHIHATVRRIVARLDGDRPLGPDIDAVSAHLHERDWPREDLLA